MSKKKLLNDSTRQLERCLPPGWSIEALMEFGPTGAGLRITSSEGHSRTFSVLLKRRIDPRMANQFPADPALFVAAPYLSKSVRQILDQLGASYVDHTGNIRVVIDKPGLFILTQGAETNPSPEKKKASLRGVKAGRVVQALVTKPPPLGVRELAEFTDTDPGYVSRLLKMLDNEAIVERDSRGQVEKVDWWRMLEQWSEDAPLSKRSEPTTWVAPRGLKNVLEGLKSADFPYLLTGSAAASQIVPIAPTRLLSIYVDDPERAAEALGLRRADAGANVILLQPNDDALYQPSTEIEGLKQARLPLLVADLLTGPGRSPAEAKALMDWMQENEEVWRG